MEAGKNSVTYMGLIPGPNKTDEICGKTMVTGTMYRGSTVCVCLCVCVCVYIYIYIGLCGTDEFSLSFRFCYHHLL
jgi:hypothetical protein